MRHFQVGAGKAEIRYTQDMLPTFGENYTGIHDLPMVQALLLQGRESYAILSADVVILFIKKQLLAVAAEELGIPEKNILLHATHTLSTPHFHAWKDLEDWRNDPPHRRLTLSDEEVETYMRRDNLMAQAHIEAVRAACRSARENLQPARMGHGIAKAPISVNRVVETRDGWWQGANPDGPSDHRVPVLRFDTLDGTPIAIVYNCNVAPGCLEGSTFDGQRLISGDLASASERYVDEAFDGELVSLYLTGFTGDQWQALRANNDRLTRGGEQIIEDLGLGGFALVDVLAARLAQQVARAADGIANTQADIEPRLDRYTFRYTGQRSSPRAESGPTRSCSFEEAGPMNAEIAVLQLGEIAVVACGVELCYETAERIKRESPFAQTLIMEFTTEGGGYLPEEIFYDRMSFQARKSRYARGTAERFGDDVIASLRDAKEKYNQK